MTHTFIHSTTKTTTTTNERNGMEKEETKEACLSFLKGKKFECVDNHLNTNTTTSSKQDGKSSSSSSVVLVCGRSPHLSTFAILLATSTKSECADTPYFWVAIGLLGGMCLCIVVVVIVEWRVRWVKRLVVGQEAMAAEIPGARLVIYADVGHLPVIEAPERVAADLPALCDAIAAR